MMQARGQLWDYSRAVVFPASTLIAAITQMPALDARIVAVQRAA